MPGAGASAVNQDQSSASVLTRPTATLPQIPFSGSGSTAVPGAGVTVAWPGVKIGSTVAPNPNLPPYLLPGASHQTSHSVPFHCEVDHQHPPRHTCSTTGKRKLTIYDLDVHMRCATSSAVTLDDVIGGSLSLLESMLS